MAATDPQNIVYWDEDAGPRLFFSGHYYRFVRRLEAVWRWNQEVVPERWVYVPERRTRKT